MISYLILFYDWLVVGTCFLFFHMLGMSSSQLTKSYFSEVWLDHQYDVLTIEMRQICPLRSGPCSHWCHRLWIATKWHRVQDTRWKNVARTWELPWNYPCWVLLVGIWGHNYGEIYRIQLQLELWPQMQHTRGYVSQERIRDGASPRTLNAAGNSIEISVSDR